MFQNGSRWLTILLLAFATLIIGCQPQAETESKDKTIQSAGAKSTEAKGTNPEKVESKTQAKKGRNKAIGKALAKRGTVGKNIAKRFDKNGLVKTGNEKAQFEKRFFIPNDKSPIFGDPNAPVTIIEFSDFECPYCSRGANTIKELVKKNPGKVKVVFKHNPLPFHKNAPLAHKASIAAQNQGKFWEYHDILFANKKALKRPDLEKYATQLGLDMARFNTDLDGKGADAIFAMDKKQGALAAVRGTPHFFLNGSRLSGAQPLAKFQAALDKELAIVAKYQKKGIKPAGLYKEIAKSELSSTPKPAPRKPRAAAGKPEKRQFIAQGKSPVYGKASAPITIIEFSDFECPYCSRGAKTMKDLVKANPEKVKVIFKHYPLPFHKNAPLAHKASVAAQNQGKFWEYHDILFANKKALKRPDLEKYAAQLGLDIARFKTDIDSPETAAQLAADKKQAGSAAVRGTPHFFLNGSRLSGAQPLVKFQAAVDKEMAIAAKYQKKGISADKLYATIAKTELSSSTPPAAKKAPAGAPGKPEKRFFIPKGKSVVFGDPKAPVTIIEFSDFECPYCSRGANTIKELVKKNPGKVKVLFKHYPLPFHKNAPLAHKASIAAQNQGKFWEYHDILFANKKALKRPDLEKYATQLGLDMARFKTDIDSPATAAVLAEDKKYAGTAAVRGTPHFFLNGSRLSGAQPLAKFQAALDKELAIAAKYQKKGISADKLYATIAKAEMSSSAPAPGKAAPAAAGKPEKRFLIPFGKSPVYGKPDAPVTIIEFSDFECPYCSRGANTIKELIKKHPEVKVVFKHNPLPFHKNAPLAHQASVAAQNQGKFWEYHDLLFANKKALKRPDLEKYATQLGLDMARFKTDIDSPSTLARLAADKKQGALAAVRGTPHFFLNGSRFSGAQPLAKFEAALKKEMAIVAKYQKKGVTADKLYAAIAKAEMSSTAAPGAKAARPAAPTTPVKVNIAGSPFKGPANAPVTIIEFSDFECPYCGKVKPTIAQIMKEYPTQVKIVFKQMPLPFHKNAPLAAEASLAAHAQGKFWEYHDLLFANRKAMQRADLDGYAAKLGLDMARFKADLDSHKYKAAVDKDAADAARNQIRGTPNFAINGRRLTGAQPFANFKTIIDEELKKAGK